MSAELAHPIWDDRLRGDYNSYALPAVPRRVGPAGPHARRVRGGCGGAERRRLDPVQLNSAMDADLETTRQPSLAPAAREPNLQRYDQTP